MPNAQVGLRVFLEDSLSSGLSALGGSISTFGNGLSSLIDLATQAGDSLSEALVGTAALALAADFSLFSGGLKDAITQAMSLQDALVSVQIALNATDQEMVSVGQSVTQIADTSIFSTTEVANAFAMP